MVSNRYDARMLKMKSKGTTGKSKDAQAPKPDSAKPAGKPERPKGYAKLSRVELRTMGLLDKHNNPKW